MPSLQKSRLLSRYSEQQLCRDRREPVAHTALGARGASALRSQSIQHLPGNAVPPESGGLPGQARWAPPRRRTSAQGERGMPPAVRNVLEGRSPDRVIVGKTAAQYARVRRYSEQAALDRQGGKRPISSVENSWSTERLADVYPNHHGSFLSLDAGVRGPVNRPVELYLVVRPPGKAATQTSTAVQASPRVGDMSARRSFLAETRYCDQLYTP